MLLKLTKELRMTVRKTKMKEKEIIMKKKVTKMIRDIKNKSIENVCDRKINKPT